MTAAAEPLTERIERVLREHRWEWTDGFRELICDCDEFFVDGYETAPEGLTLKTNGQDTEIPAIAIHRAHVAAVLAVLVAEEQRKAWDECCQAFAWAMKEEPTLAPVSWLAYVHDNNPYAVTDGVRG